jgi:large subunit ribosomal protein L31
MKQGIHPEYKLATVHCACGNTFQTRSTQEDIHLDVCSVCHPYFTGKQRLMDTAGRVERFRRKWAKTEEAQEEKAERDAAKAKKAAEQPESAAEPSEAAAAAEAADAGASEDEAES